MSEFKSVYEKKTSAFVKKSHMSKERNLKSFLFSKKEGKKAIEMWIQNSNRSQTEKCVKIYRKYLCEKISFGINFFGFQANELNFSFNSPSCDIQRRSSSNHINHLFSHSRMWTYQTFFPLHFYYCMSFLLLSLFAIKMWQFSTR